MENLPGHTYDIKVLVRVYVALLVLAGGMVVVSLIPAEAVRGLDWIDLHVLKGLLIFGLATIMVSIVSGFLMGLKYEKSKLNTVVFLGNFAFLALFIIFTWSDIGFRGLVYPNFDQQLNWESPVDKANKANAAHAGESHSGEAQTAPATPAH
jgi:hypothetical protein